MKAKDFAWQVGVFTVAFLLASAIAANPRVASVQNQIASL